MELIYQKMQLSDFRKLYRKIIMEINIYQKKKNYSGKKAKNAQEAHEAIRPTDIIRTPERYKKIS